MDCASTSCSACENISIATQSGLVVPSQSTRISEGTTAVVQGQLGQWNTAGLTAGAYTLRLVVIDKDNNRTSHSVIVYVGQNAPAVTTTTTPAPNTTPNTTPAAQPTATPLP